MIIRNNLASSPTRNYSLYIIGCLVLAVTAGLFSVYNVMSLTRWYRESSSLGQKITAQQKQMVDLRKKETALRAEILKVKTPEFIERTEFINAAIKRRVFSWSDLFNQLELVFPRNVKMISISPSVSTDKVALGMFVAGRNLSDIVELIGVLENSPVFRNVTFKSERLDSDGLFYANISVTYLPQNIQKQPVEKAAEVQEPPEKKDEAPEEVYQ